MAEGDIRAEKDALRQRLKCALHNLPLAYCAESDTAILAALLALPAYRDAGTIFCYLSVGGEPDTHAFIAAALAAGKQVCAPACGPGGRMEARALTAADEAVPGYYNLPEPPPGAAVVPPEMMDLVVAPCVAADAAGHRLGNGGGYYDRYLAKVSCPVVCLCRGRLLQRALPAQAFDRRADIVLTEEGQANANG